MQVPYDPTVDEEQVTTVEAATTTTPATTSRKVTIDSNGNLEAVTTSGDGTVEATTTESPQAVDTLPSKPSEQSSAADTNATKALPVGTVIAIVLIAAVLIAVTLVVIVIIVRKRRRDLAATKQPVQHVNGKENGTAPDAAPIELHIVANGKEANGYTNG